MPTSVSARRDLLVDTSVAVALVVADHDHHAETTRTVGRRRFGLAGARDAETLLGRLASLGIAGGAVSEALVGAVAVAHGVPLATRDQRALDVELFG